MSEANPPAREKAGEALAPPGRPGEVARFSTDALPREQRFATWRDSISVLFDVQARAQRGDFHASVTTIQFGNMLLGETTASAQIFHRDLGRICADGIDHFLIQCYSTGDARARFHETEQAIQAGDVLLIDAAQPSTFVCSDFSNLTLVVPRSQLDSRLPQAERLHGRVLSRDLPVTRLLAENLRLLRELGPSFGPDTIGSVADAALDLAARCLSLAGAGNPEAAPDLRVATLTAIKRFIEVRLEDSDLGPDSVLQAFRMSRAYLYELFEQYGGVMRYIQRRRLARCLAALQDPANRRRKIADIAFAYGFTSEAHFSRTFRRAFGMTPSDARDKPAADAQPDTDDLVDRRYEAWLRDIGA